MKNNTSILMGGVGGQGIVLASRLWPMLFRPIIMN